MLASLSQSPILLFVMVKRKYIKVVLCIILAGLFCRLLSYFHWLYKVHYDTPNLQLYPIPTVNIEPNLRGREIFLLVLVTTPSWRSDSFERREAIRTTWAHSSKISPWSTSVVVFNIGRTYTSIVDERIANEASQHGDILVGDYEDTYANIIIKVFFAFDWAMKLNCKFVVKADDDVYLRLPNLVKWLQSQETPERLYAGVLAEKTLVIRSPEHRHFVSYKTYNYSHWKTYARGFAYVISVALLPELREAVKFHQLFPVDDCYFGLLTETIRVKPRHLPNCSRRLNNNRKLRGCNDCVYRASICIGSPLTVTHMFYVHVRVSDADAMHQKHLETNCSENDWGDPWGSGVCK